MTNTENKQFLKGLAMLNMLNIYYNVKTEKFGVHYLFDSHEKIYTEKPICVKTFCMSTPWSLLIHGRAFLKAHVL